MIPSIVLLGSAHEDPRRALPRLVNGRLRFVGFKRGANGGVLYDAHDERSRLRQWYGSEGQR